MAYYVYDYYIGNKIKLLTHVFIYAIISLVKGHCPQLKEVLQ